MKKKFPFKVKKLDMSKANGHNHPDIKPNKGLYLCGFTGGYGWHIGRFSKQWYGLNFDGIYDAGLQFDAPGQNASDWREIWEILP